MAKSAIKHRGPKAKVTFRHNFFPVIIGFLMFAGILGLLNSQWIAAQAQYRFAPKVSAADIAVATTNKASAKSLQLSVPTLGIEAPVVYEPSMQDWKIQIGLRSGVVHLGPTAVPGQVGNVVIVGHSSQVAWAPGGYKFIFTLLNKLKKGDLATVDYQGTRYVYRVTGSEVIDPTNFSVIQPTTDSQLTLITCTPVGTSTNRLVIHAQQISPNPSKNKASDRSAASGLSALPR